MRSSLAISLFATATFLLALIMAAEPVVGSPVPSTKDGNGSSSSSNKKGKDDQTASVKDKTQAEKDKTQKEVHDYIASQKADQNKIWGGSKERPQPWQSPPYSHQKGSKS
ncbi:uncharacterized protein FA14DRAFT_154551 [Meira miltonrushii]|uniref:Uncharacterized protein n=1 Tax=Meira miltonrushii TaxID=1280837 RepID=A0A316VHY7_9BASI|nr:uncharacterized protein FA14DRAFT_154551 [Meira miltonrushii]PWN35125.1 hypothetical protein FA14DRAFT_154551 [Meira miltonrushii]